METEVLWILIIVIIQGAIVGGFCSFMAKEKNRDVICWFFLGFFFSFIAILALIGVPEIKEEEIIENSASQMEEELSEDEWKCRCGEINSKHEEHCVNCGRALNAIV